MVFFNWFDYASKFNGLKQLELDTLLCSSLRASLICARASTAVLGTEKHSEQWDAAVKSQAIASVARFDFWVDFLEELFHEISAILN